MRSQIFRGIPSLLEVECRWAGDMDREMKLWALSVFRFTDNIVLARVNPIADQCVTLEEFSSCFIDQGDTGKSRVKILVSDLDEGESRKFGCNATGLKLSGHTQTQSWSLLVTRQSKYAVFRRRTLSLALQCTSVLVELFLYIHIKN